MFRRRKQTTSGSYGIGRRRDKLVEEFIKAYPVAKSNASRTVFDFPVSTSTGVVALQMTLPVGFPQSRPIVVSRTQIRHHLFDTTMRVVGSASLQTWTEHSRYFQFLFLGAGLKDISKGWEELVEDCGEHNHRSSEVCICNVR
eukprot:1251291-Amorphochlora_amoeboformis.AAC.2